MCIWAQPSPTGSTPDSYVVSLPGVEYVTVRARFTTRAPASPSRPRTTTAPTTPYAVHTPISLVPRLAELGLPSDAVEADRRIGQPHPVDLRRRVLAEVDSDVVRRQPGLRPGAVVPALQCRRIVLARHLAQAVRQWVELTARQRGVEGQLDGDQAILPLVLPTDPAGRARLDRRRDAVAGVPDRHHPVDTGPFRPHDHPDPDLVALAQHPDQVVHRTITSPGSATCRN